jgi:transposase
MADLSLDLKQRIVEAYFSGRTRTYEATAEMFKVGRATVSRLLRRKRETGDVQQKPRGGNRPRVMDLAWLREHAQAHPDARLIDRVEAWRVHSGCRVSAGTVWNALRVIGWTHKKKRQ